jgi:hypothetical protein
MAFTREGASAVVGGAARYCPMPLVPEEVALAYVPLREHGVPAPSTLVLRRGRDGRLRADSFPETIDVDEALAARRDPRVVRLERGRLYVTAANGQAVYVPVGESPVPRCVQYGRLYLRIEESR